MPQVSYHGASVNAAGASSYSFASSPIGTAGQERSAIVGFAWHYGSSARTLSSVTIGGETAVIIDQIGDNGGSGFAIALARIEIKSASPLFNLSTATVEAAFSGNCNGCARLSWTINLPVAAAAPHDFAKAAEHVSGVTSLTGFDAPARGVAIAIAITNNTGTSHSYAGVTEDVDANSGDGFAYSGGHAEGLSAETGRTMSVTGATSSNRQALLAASWQIAEISGSLASTLGALTLDADGVLEASGVVGAAEITLGALTSDADGKVDVAGAAAITLGALTLDAESRTPISGSAAITLGALDLDAAGGSFLNGAAAITLGALTLAAAGSTGAPTRRQTAMLFVGA